MHYEAILQSIDLSNAKANEYGFLLKQSYPTAKELPVIQKRIADISRQMSNQGWNPFRPIFGRTGRFNIDPD